MTNQPAEVPTSRTRAFTDKMRAEYFPHALGGTPYIKAVAFARKLERENIALLTALQELVDAEDASIDQFTAVEIDRIEAAMDKARAAIKSATEEKAAHDPYCDALPPP